MLVFSIIVGAVVMYYLLGIAVESPEKMKEQEIEKYFNDKNERDSMTLAVISDKIYDQSYTAEATIKQIKTILEEAEKEEKEKWERMTN